MDTDRIKAVLDRVLTWPIERQKDAVNMLLMMEASDNSPYHLTAEQAAEVRRRLADKDAKTLTLEEVRQHFARRGCEE